MFLIATMVGCYAQKERRLVLNEETGLIEATYFYDNGQVSQKGAFSRDGKLEGLWVSYDQNGGKLSQGTYNNGVKTGKWTFWDGSLIREVEFDNNIIAGVIEKNRVDSGVVGKD